MDPPNFVGQLDLHLVFGRALCILKYRRGRMVEEHDGKVSNIELGGTSMDLSKFEALKLKDSPQTLESADRVVMHVDPMVSGMLDSTIAESSAQEKKKLSEIPRKYWPPKNQGDISFAKRQAEKEYAERQAQSLQARRQYTHASKEEIARNAKKLICEEAFRRYSESEDDLKELEYEFDELLHQCFYVEHHFEAFYHLNFTVKIKKHGSADWISVMYFAEVRAIRGIKHYVCYPLDPDENGECYACQKKGMHELRHPLGLFCSVEYRPIIGYCEDSDSDEFHPTMGGSESDDDMS